MAENHLQLLGKIETFIFDVDGVLTDGSLLLLPSGEQVRKMNIKDGFALKMAMRKGFHVGIISGGTSEAVKQRFQRLGVHDVHMGAAYKMEVFEEMMLTYNLEPEKTLYMGDDIPDFEVMEKVLMPACPANAAEEIKGISKYISDKKGGEGCVRDIIEKTMRIQGKWFDPEKVQEEFERFKW